jgi:hypothetical protein
LLSVDETEREKPRRARDSILCKRFMETTVSV